MGEPSVTTRVPASTRPRPRTPWAVLGSLVLVGAVLGGFRSGASGVGFEVASKVVVISVPGLRWQDLAATPTPAFDALLGSSALLSTRGVGMELDLLEGYLTFNSANALEASWPTGSEPVIEVGADGCAPELAVAASRGVDTLTGADVGALGTALRDAGIERRVFGGPQAVAALIDGQGCVDSHGSLDETQIGDGVTVVELTGLESVDDELERSRIIALHEQHLRRLDVPDDAVVIVMAPTGPTEAADVTVVAIRDGAAHSSDDGLLASATTRRMGYVRLSDLAPTVLGSLGIDVPSSMVGTRASSFPDATPLASRVTAHADLAERARFRDRAIWPVSVAVVLATLVCLVAALARRFGAATWSGSLCLALVTWSFLSGTVAYHRLPLWGYSTGLLCLSALTVLLATRAARPSGRSPVDLLGVVLWILLVVDVMAGGRLQINTPLGYSPIVAGRFQGVGNLAFALLAAAALVTAVTPAHSAGCDSPRARRWFLLWVGAVSSIVVATPRFGSDVGGTLALVPAFVVAAALVSGRTASWRHLVVAGLGTSVGVLLLGLLDRSRPSGEQTHLGRFVDRLLDGEAGPILRRKLRSNLELFTASIWPALLLVLVVVLAVVVWRRRSRLRVMLQGRSAEQAFLGGLGVVAGLGFLLNDSGVAVPAMMLAVGVPWIASHVMTLGAGAST